MKIKVESTETKLVALTDKYQAQVKTETGNGWWRIGNTVDTIEEARQTIRDYGKAQTIGDMGDGVCMLYIPADKTVREFRIVKLQRTLMETITK